MVYVPRLFRKTKTVRQIFSYKGEKPFVVAPRQTLDIILSDAEEK